MKTDVWTTWADVNIRRIAFDESCLGSAANNNTTNWNTQQFCHSNVIKFDWQKAFLVRELLLGGGGGVEDFERGSRGFEGEYRRGSVVANWAVRGLL